MTGLPDYLERALADGVLPKAPYNLLTPEEWRDLAEHVFNDQISPLCCPRTFFPRNNLPENRTLSPQTSIDRLLHDTVVGHSGAIDLVPHYQKIVEVYQKLYSEKIKNHQFM